MFVVSPPKVVERFKLYPRKVDILDGAEIEQWALEIITAPELKNNSLILLLESNSTMLLLRMVPNKEIRNKEGLGKVVLEMITDIQRELGAPELMVKETIESKMIPVWPNKGNERARYYIPSFLRKINSIIEENDEEDLEEIFEEVLDNYNGAEYPDLDQKSPYESYADKFINFIDKQKEENEEENGLIYDSVALLFKEPMLENAQKSNELMNELIEESQGDKDEARIKEIKDQLNEISDFDPTYFQLYNEDLKIPDDWDWSGEKRQYLDFIATLDPRTGSVVRRHFVVPSDLTFEELDKIVSTVFQWKGYPYHLSSFLFPVKSDAIEEKDIEVQVTRELEDLDENIYKRPIDSQYLDLYNPFYKVPIKKMKDTKISELFPKYERAYYRYDFGDNWYHALELIDAFTEYGSDDPVLVESIGVAPPEDFGGVYVYGDFIKHNWKDLDQKEILQRMSELIKKKEESQEELKDLPIFIIRKTLLD